MRTIFFYLGVLMIGVSSCSTSSNEQQESVADKLEPGTWRGVLHTQDIEIPFNFEVVHTAAQTRIELINAQERIPLETVELAGDSIHIPLYIFDATIHAKIVNQRQLKGTWVKNYAEDYVIPFEAAAGISARFPGSGEESATSFDGKWEVDFISEDGVDKAIGVFKQDGSKVTGTFLTPTGDYRFLEGMAAGNTMQLSCFDGTHAYYFKAVMQDDGSLMGDFWSGKSWHQRWTAERNASFELPDPYAMTYMKEGYESFDIRFPNTSGEMVSLQDERYRNKVVVVQILGTWCPNCMDETSFYVDWYRRNKDRDVEFLGLAFERKADRDYATRRIENMKQKLEVEYEVLIAGTTDSASRAQALPMLSRIMSFPTSIILDKQHKVRKIHTGFSGPGTGVYYEQFVEQFELMMDMLLKE